MNCLTELQHRLWIPGRVTCGQSCFTETAGRKIPSLAFLTMVSFEMLSNVQKQAISNASVMTGCSDSVQAGGDAGFSHETLERHGHMQVTHMMLDICCCTDLIF